MRGKSKYLIFFLFLCVLPILFAAIDPNYTGDVWLYVFSDSYVSKMGFLVAVALFAGAIIVTITYMFANLVNQESLKAAAKLELFEIFYSGILFVFLFSFFLVFDNIAGESVPLLYTSDTVAIVSKLALTENASYGALPKHFIYPKYFLSSLFNEAIQFNEVLYGWYSFTGLLGDIYLSLDLFWEQRSFINYMPIRGLVHQGNVIKMEIFDLVVKVALISKFQELFFHIFISGFFPVFLTAGLILRSFSVTRKLGGLMMAIALALYFVFPLAYIFAGAVYDHAGGIGSLTINMETAEHLLNPFYNVGVESDKRTLEDLQNQYPDLKSLEEDIAEQSTADVCSLLQSTDDPDPDTSEVEGMSIGIGEWMDNFKENAIGVWSSDESYFKIPAKLIFFSMFFSFFGLMATVAAIRSVSAILGGDLEIAGLTHLI